MLRFADQPVDLTREQLRASLRNAHELGAARVRAELRHRLMVAGLVVAALGVPVMIAAAFFARGLS